MWLFTTINGFVLAEILLSLQAHEGPVGRIKPLGGAGHGPCDRVLVLVQVVLDRGNMQTALRIEDILALGFVKANGDVVVGCLAGPLRIVERSARAARTAGRVGLARRDNAGFPGSASASQRQA